MTPVFRDPVIRNAVFHPGQINIQGPLFMSRGTLAAVCLVLWAATFYLALGAGPSSERGTGSIPSLHLIAAGLDLLVLLIAFLASSTGMHPRHAAALRILWLLATLGSACCVAAATAPVAGLALVVENALLTAVSVLLLTHLWNLRGCVFLTLVAALVSTGSYLLSPGAESQAALNILFLSLFPGLVAASSVSLRREAIRRKGVSALNARLELLTRAIDAGTAAREAELADTKAQVDELLAKVRRDPTLPLDHRVAREAQELAQDLRRLLLEAWSGNWLTEALDLEGLDHIVAVAEPTVVLEEVVEASRPAILSATMLMAVGRALRSTQKGAHQGPRVLVVTEPASPNTVRIAWRISGVRRSRLSPLLWTELGSLGDATVRGDREGCTISVETKSRAR
ncbi:hypothetical protein AB6813_07760 [bacterium RCC_150]